MRGFKKPLTSLIFILLILNLVPIGTALENAVDEASDFGQIEITTIPNGSEIYIDDIYRGATPARLTDVPPKFYEVVLKQEGYDDIFERVLVRAGETSVISKKLSFKEGVCSISSEPSGARVYLEGKYKGITPVVFHTDEGNHSLKIKKTGYGTLSKEVNVSFDEPFVLKEKLHLSIFVYLASALILLVGGVFVKKKPEIPEFKILPGSGSLEKYKKKLGTVGKREEKQKEEEEEKERETSASREKESAGKERGEVEAGEEAVSYKLVELEKMPETEFRYTVKKKENDQKE